MQTSAYSSVQVLLGTLVRINQVQCSIKPSKKGLRRVSLQTFQVQLILKFIGGTDSIFLHGEGIILCYIQSYSTHPGLCWTLVR